MTLQIKKAEADDIPGIRSLFNSYTAPPKSAYFFQWWNNIPSVTFCAISAGKIVGMFVVLKRRLANNLNCGVLMGLIVAKEWRGSGLFRELGVTAMNYFEDIDLFCCLTNSVGKKALEKNFDFITADSIETMTLSNDTPLNCSGYACTPITSNTRFNNFELDTKGVLMFLADEKFRRWRFAVHPRHSYNLVRMDSMEFVVVNKYYDAETNIRYGDIVDFEAQGLEENRLIDIFGCASDSLKKDVDEITVQAIPNSPLHRSVRKIGFAEKNLKHYFCLKVQDPSNKHLYNASNWLIKWGDYLR
jgi:GNAT superfamily N-acetyltransferase